jgi:mRNA interferase HigB
MRIIKPSALKAFTTKHPDAAVWLRNWKVVTKAARWASINDVRRTYPSADAATTASGATVTVFNVRGNNYRLIVAIHYNTQRVYVREFLTHAEYNDQKWKRRH